MFKTGYRDLAPMTSYLTQLHLGFLIYGMESDSNFYAVKLCSEGEGEGMVLCIPKNSMPAMHFSH